MLALFMVHTAKEILFSRTNYTRFKGNFRICVKQDIVFIQCMINYWHFDGTASSSSLNSSCLIDLLLFNFQLTSDIKIIYWYHFSSTIDVFFYRHNIYSQDFFFLVDFFHGQFVSMTFPIIQGHFQDLENEFVIFQDEWEPRLLVNRLIKKDVITLNITYLCCWLPNNTVNSKYSGYVSRVSI